MSAQSATPSPAESRSERMRALARKRWDAKRAGQGSENTALAAGGAKPRRTPSAAVAHAPASRVIAITSADIPESQRRKLFDLAVAELEAQLQATQHLPLMDRGKVIGHREVPDNAARIKAIGQTFALLGSTSPGARGGASHPPKIEIKVAQFGPRPSAPPVSARVIEASEA